MYSSVDDVSPMDDLLAGLCRRERIAAASLFTSMSVRPGHVLARQGRPGREAMFIESGAARVERHGAPIARAGRGDFVGELALLTGPRRTATVTAMTPMLLFVLSATEFQSLLFTSPVIAQRILARAVDRLARLRPPTPPTPAMPTPSCTRRHVPRVTVGAFP